MTDTLRTEVLRGATALARLLRKAGTSSADAAPRIRDRHGLTDAELRSVLTQVWGGIVQCEGTSTRPHPHAFGTRMPCRCTSAARHEIDGSKFCGRCVKNPRKWIADTKKASR